MRGLAVALVGLLFGLGIVGIGLSWAAPRLDAPLSGGVGRFRDGVRRNAAPIGLATAAGLAIAWVTGWPVALPIAAAAVFGLPKLFGQTSSSVSIVKIQAIATWTEMLQGTMAASAGLGQAIIATAPLSPPPIRRATNLLSARLSAGMHPRGALLQFADELEDPCADRVVCALQLAISSRAQHLGELLLVLADSTRDEVALRLRIETSRASLRSGVRTVLVFSVAFAAALCLFARTYLSPFGSSQGQIVLLLVGALYGLGLTSMVAMARPNAPIRLLGQHVEEE
jgi:tight adherence protein B